MKEKLSSILDHATNLPVLPHVAMDILRLVDSNKSNSADIEKIIKNDQVLTLRILKMANSAYYGYPREIINIREAVVILGMDTLKSLVLSLMTQQLLSQNLEIYGLQQSDLWKHSMVVAMLARSLAKKAKLPNYEQFFISGLLHDIGKLLLDFYLRDHYEMLVAQINEGGLNLVEAEERLIGFDHAYIGSKLLEHWSLPLFLVEMVRYHHFSSQVPLVWRDKALILDLANRLSYRLAKGNGSNLHVLHQPLPNQLQDVGITENEIKPLIKSIKVSLESITI